MDLRQENARNIEVCRILLAQAQADFDGAFDLPQAERLAALEDAWARHQEYSAELERLKAYRDILHKLIHN